MQAHAHLTTKRETFWRMAKLWGFIIINNKELQFRRNFRNSSRKNMRYSVSWPSKRDKLDMLEWPSSTPEVQKMCDYLTIKLPEKHPQIEEKKQLKSCMKAIVTHLIVEQDERLLGLERPFFTMFSRFWRHRSGLTCIKYKKLKKPMYTHSQIDWFADTQKTNSRRYRISGLEKWERVYLPVSSFSSILVIDVIQPLNYLLECWSPEWVLTPTFLNQPVNKQKVSFLNLKFPL